jgi:hypothetical protein
MGKGRIELNTAGGLYIMFATEEHYERATGNGKIKIGLSYSCEWGTIQRYKEHSTSCADKIHNIALWACDEGTDIPTPEGTKGGVFEMEQYLHSVCKSYGWEQIGSGKEWFAVPMSVIQMINDITAGESFDYTACPEIARSMYYAPKFEDMPSMDETRRRTWCKKSRDRKISTCDRSPMQMSKDTAAERTYARDYMLNRGEVK